MCTRKQLGLVLSTLATCALWSAAARASDAGLTVDSPTQPSDVNAGVDGQPGNDLQPLMLNDAEPAELMDMEGPGPYGTWAGSGPASDSGSTQSTLAPGLLNAQVDCNGNGVDDSTETGIWDNDEATQRVQAWGFFTNQLNGNINYNNREYADDFCLSTCGSSVAGPNVITSIKFKAVDSVSGITAIAGGVGKWNGVFNWNRTVRIQIYPDVVPAEANSSLRRPDPGAAAQDFTVSTVSRRFLTAFGFTGEYSGVGISAYAYEYYITGINIVVPAGHWWINVRPVSDAVGNSTNGGRNWIYATEANIAPFPVMRETQSCFRDGNPAANTNWRPSGDNYTNGRIFGVGYKLYFGSDADSNGTLDDCEDCNTNSLADQYEAWADCNTNGIRDICDIKALTVNDCNTDGTPDLCQRDCNTNGINDVCEGTLDCDSNGSLDMCEADGATYVVHDQTGTLDASSNVQDRDQISVSYGNDVQLGSFYVQADDFHLNATTLIKAIAFDGRFVGAVGSTATDIFTVRIWSDTASNGNTDRVPNTAVPALFTENITGTANLSYRTILRPETASGSGYQVTAKFSHPLLLPAGDYWLEYYHRGPLTTGLWYSSVGMRQQRGAHVVLSLANPPNEAFFINGVQFDLLHMLFKIYGSVRDCNTNSKPDGCDGVDANTDGTLDACQDCNNNGTFDFLEAGYRDCNSNGVFDICETGILNDCNTDTTPDICQIAGRDCNTDFFLDVCDVMFGDSDCNTNSTPDSCEPDCNTNGIEDACDISNTITPLADCNTNWVPDLCDIGLNLFQDYNAPDSGNAYFADVNRSPQGFTVADDFILITTKFISGVQVHGGFFGDAQAGAPPDNNSNDFTVNMWTNGGFSLPDVRLYTKHLHGTNGITSTQNGFQAGRDVILTLKPQAALPAGHYWLEVVYTGTGPGEKTTNANTWTWLESSTNFGLSSAGSLAPGLQVWSSNLDTNGQLMFQLYEAYASDCNSNITPDACEIALADCNSNGIKDICEFSGSCADANSNGTLDACENLGALDCNTNGTIDSCEVGGDCDTNGTKDACELTPIRDCNSNGLLDVCETAPPVTSHDGGVNASTNSPAGDPIPDNDAVTGALDLLFAFDGNTSSVIRDVNLRFSINHDRLIDLNLKLSHGLNTVTVVNNSGANAAGNFTNTVLDDQAANAISTGTPPYTGTFKPDSPMTVWNGLTQSGGWALKVTDTLAGNTGSLVSWTIYVTTTDSSDCNSNGRPDVCDVPDCNTNLRPDICDLTKRGTPVTYNSTGGPQAIADNTTNNTENFIVTTGVGVVADVNVKLNISHNVDADLDCWVGQGTDIEVGFPPLAYSFLFAGPSQTLGWGAGANFANTLFDDDGTTNNIDNGTPPFAGTFNPRQALARLNGLPVAGTWHIGVSDLSLGNTGSLDSWSLIVTPVVTDDANANGTPDECDPACPFCQGDINGDNKVDGSDIPGWVRCTLGVPLAGDFCGCHTTMTTSAFATRLVTGASTTCP